MSEYLLIIPYFLVVMVAPFAIILSESQIKKYNFDRRKQREEEPYLPIGPYFRRFLYVVSFLWLIMYNYFLMVFSEARAWPQQVSDMLETLFVLTGNACWIILVLVIIITLIEKATQEPEKW